MKSHSCQPCEIGHHSHFRNEQAKAGISANTTSWRVTRPVMTKWIACLSVSENVVCFLVASKFSVVTPRMWCHITRHHQCSSFFWESHKENRRVPWSASHWRTQTGAAQDLLCLSMSACVHMYAVVPGSVQRDLSNLRRLKKCSKLKESEFIWEEGKEESETRK